MTILSFTGILALHAQTADEIINKHLAAMGGKDLIKSVKSLYQEGSMEVLVNDAPMGGEAPTMTYIVFGKAFKNVVTFNGQEIIQCSSDKGSWMINPMAGAATATAMPDDQANAAKMRYDWGGNSGPLLDYAAKGNKVEFQGKDSVGGKKVYKLKVTTKDNIVMQYYIDATTWYLTKVVATLTAAGQEIETTTDFSDYKKLDNGLVASHAQKLTLPQFVLNLTVKKVELNKAIDPTIFDMPK